MVSFQNGQMVLKNYCAVRLVTTEVQ